jgi:hypothetical protein
MAVPLNRRCRFGDQWMLGPASVETTPAATLAPKKIESIQTAGFECRHG